MLNPSNSRLINCKEGYGYSAHPARAGGATDNTGLGRVYRAEGPLGLGDERQKALSIRFHTSPNGMLNSSAPTGEVFLRPAGAAFQC